MDNEKYIASAVADFEKILREQLARNEKMKSAPPATDYAVLDKIVIGCCGGGGIGPGGGDHYPAKHCKLWRTVHLLCGLPAALFAAGAPRGLQHGYGAAPQLQHLFL